MKKSIIIGLLTMLGVYALLFALPTPLYAWLYNISGHDNPENAAIIHIWSGIILLAGIMTFCTSLIISEIRKKDKKTD